MVTAKKSHPKYAERVTLEPCPFCAGKARIKTVSIFADTGYRAVCGSCGVGTGVVIVGEYINWRGESGKTFTDDAAAMEAARIWNERSEGL